jgi:hypothetical protein
MATYLVLPTTKSLKGFEDSVKKALEPMKRPDKAAGLGFFEQGIQTGAILFLLSVLSSTGYLGYFVWKSSSRWWR